MGRFICDLDKMKAAIIFLALVVVGVFAENDESPSQRFLIGVRKTKVYSTATTSTLSVAYTCYSKFNTGTCSGKRRRRRELVPINNPDESLDSSVDLSPTVVEGLGVAQEKLVVWTSTTTTLTFTSSTTISGTTLSVNFSCTASGISLPPACG